MDQLDRWKQSSSFIILPSAPTSTLHANRDMYAYNLARLHVAVGFQRAVCQHGNQKPDIR